MCNTQTLKNTKFYIRVSDGLKEVKNKKYDKTGQKREYKKKRQLKTNTISPKIKSSFTQSNNETLSYYNIYTQQKSKAAFVSLFITLRLDKSDNIKK